MIAWFQANGVYVGGTCLLSVVAGLLELTVRLGRWPGLPIVRKGPALRFLGLYMGVSLAALVLMSLFGWDFALRGSTVDPMVARMFVAGLGAIAFLHTSFRFWRGSEQEVKISIDRAIKLLLDQSARELMQIQNDRDNTRINRELGDALSGVTVNEAATIARILADRLPSSQEKDANNIKRGVRKILREKGDDAPANAVKVFLIGGVLLKYVRAETIKDVAKTLKDQKQNYPSA